MFYLMFKNKMILNWIELHWFSFVLIFSEFETIGDVVLQIGQSFIYTSEYMSVMNGSHSQDTFKSIMGFNNKILCRLI